MLSSAVVQKADLDVFLITVIAILAVMFAIFAGMMVYLRYRNKEYYRKRKKGLWKTEPVKAKEQQKRVIKPAVEKKREKQPTAEIVAEEVKIQEIQPAAVLAERTGEPVISVKNVTMKFKVATSNVSGIKGKSAYIYKRNHRWIVYWCVGCTGVCMEASAL